MRVAVAKLRLNKKVYKCDTASKVSLTQPQ